MEQLCLDDQGGEQSTRNVAEAAQASLPWRVDLSESILSLSDTHALAVSLAQASHVMALDLSYSNLKSEHFQVLCSYGGVQHLQSIDLVGNRDFHGNGIAILAGALGSNGQLQYFNVAECNLDINDCAALERVLITNRHLSTLNLSGNTFSSEALRLLQPALAGSQLVHLCLANTSMDAEGARVIGEVLSANRYLQALNLALNPLGNSGAALVLECAKEAKCLGMLNLNKIGADCALMPSLETTIQERARTADDFQSGQSLDRAFGGHSPWQQHHQDGVDAPVWANATKLSRRNRVRHAHHPEWRNPPARSVRELHQLHRGRW